MRGIKVKAAMSKGWAMELEGRVIAFIVFRGFDADEFLKLHS